MTSVIIDDTLPYTQSIATSGQTVFDTNWTADDDTDIQVYARATGVAPNDATQLVDPANYTVSFVGAEEYVRVTFLSGRTLNDVVTITRLTPPDRMNLYTNTNFTPSMLNGDFGRVILITQQNMLYWYQIGPRYNTNATITQGTDTKLPILGAGQVWRKNAGNTAIEAVDFPDGDIAPADQTYVTITDETASLPNSVVLTGTANQINVSNTAVISIPNNPVIPGSAGMGIPQGTTAERVVPASGIGLRYNTTLGQIEFYAGGTWNQLEDSTDIATLLALLASHTPGEGASLIGLEGSGTVQDFTELAFILKTASVLAPNAQALGALTTGILKSTTGTGTLSISAPLTSIDGLTTVANNLLYTTAPDTYAVITPANDAVLVTSAGGVPSLSNTLPTAVQDNITRLGTQTEALDMGSNRINNVTDPSTAQDAATKNYVDQTALNGTSVYAATTANLNATQAGAGVGATLTDNSGTFAALTLDGVAIPLNSDVLVKDYASAQNEGIYKLTTNGDGISVPWQLTRSTTYDTPTEINNTGLIVVRNGATLAGTAWYNTSTIVTVDTTAFSYLRFGITTPVTVANGGTGNSSLTAYAVLCGGTTSTNPVQSIASLGTAGQVLTSNGAGALPTMQDPAAGGFNSIVVQTFTANGTYTPTAGMQFCTVEIVGGGGGGGGCGNGSGNNAYSGGGASGGYCKKLYNATEIGANAAVTIGASGSGGAAGNNNGVAGGNSEFNPAGTGVTLTANGGGGGNANNGTGTTNISTGGTGGTASNGDLNISGQNGGFGAVYGSGIGGGGAGADSVLGLGGIIRAQSVAGINATGYGAGGSGAYNDGAGSNLAGGNGSAGVCIVTEYIV